MLTIAEHTHLIISLNNVPAVIRPKCFKQTQCLRKMALRISIWKGNMSDLSLWLYFKQQFQSLFLTTLNTFTPLTFLFFSVLSWAVWFSLNMQVLAVYHEGNILTTYILHCKYDVQSSVCYRNGTKVKHSLPFPFLLYTSIMSRFNTSYISKRLYIGF